MSYILDALRKSEKERQKRTSDSLTPDSLAGEATVAQRHGRRGAAFALGGAAVLLVALGGAILLYQPVFFTPAPANTAVKEERETIAQRNIPAPQQSNNTVSSVKDAVEPVAEPALEPAQPPPRAQEQTIPPPTTETPPLKHQVPLFTDLPPEIRNAIPRMQFNGHVYSPDPSRRMIMANGAIAREGDMVNADVRLVEITEFGLLLDYQGTLFRLRLL